MIYDSIRRISQAHRMIGKHQVRKANLPSYSNTTTSLHISEASVMELIVNIACALIGIIGTDVIRKHRNVDKWKWTCSLSGLMMCIRSGDAWRMILPVVKKSDSLKKAVQMTGHKIEIYCNSRWFRHTANRNLLNAWHDFQETLSVAVPQRPGTAMVLKRCQNHLISDWM